MSEYTLISNEVLKFLNGEGPLEGRHFGEHEYGLPMYWWRKYLPNVCDHKCDRCAEPDWLESNTSTSEPWKNVLIPLAERLLIADGSVKSRDDVINNLHRRIEEQKEENAALRIKLEDLQAGKMADGLLLEKKYAEIDALRQRLDGQVPENCTQDARGIRTVGLHGGLKVAMPNPTEADLNAG